MNRRGFLGFLARTPVAIAAGAVAAALPAASSPAAIVIPELSPDELERFKRAWNEPPTLETAVRAALPKLRKGARFQLVNITPSAVKWRPS